MGLIRTSQPGPKILNTEFTLLFSNADVSLIPYGVFGFFSEAASNSRFFSTGASHGPSTSKFGSLAPKAGSRVLALCFYRCLGHGLGLHRSERWPLTPPRCLSRATPVPSAHESSVRLPNASPTRIEEQSNIDSLRHKLLNVCFTADDRKMFIPKIRHTPDSPHDSGMRILSVS